MEKSENMPDSGNAAHSDIRLQPVGMIKSTIKEPFLAAKSNGLTIQGRIEAIRKNIREMCSQISESYHGIFMR